MEVFLYVLLAAVANIFGGLIILWKKDWSKTGLNSLMAISAGMLLSIGIIDLAPEALEVNHKNGVFILLGIILIYFFQQFVASHFHFGEETHHHGNSNSAIVGAMLGMMIHTFFDGFSIVASFEINFSLGLTVLLAILLHKIPDGLTISSIVLSLLGNRKVAFYSAVLLGASTLLGAFVAELLSKGNIVSEDITSAALSVTAGIFIYVACTDLLPEVNKSENRLISSFFILGIIIYFLIKELLSPIIGH